MKKICARCGYKGSIPEELKDIEPPGRPNEFFMCIDKEQCALRAGESW